MLRGNLANFHFFCAAPENQNMSNHDLTHLPNYFFIVVSSRSPSRLAHLQGLSRTSHLHGFCVHEEYVTPTVGGGGEDKGEGTQLSNLQSHWWGSKDREPRGLRPSNSGACCLSLFLWFPDPVQTALWPALGDDVLLTPTGRQRTAYALRDGKGHPHTQCYC